METLTLVFKKLNNYYSALRILDNTTDSEANIEILNVFKNKPIQVIYLDDFNKSVILTNFYKKNYEYFIKIKIDNRVIQYVVPDIAVNNLEISTNDLESFLYY